MTLTGTNSFGLQSRLRQLTADFVAEEGDLALERIDGSEIELERIRESIHSLPFLASKKLIVLREPSANKAFAEQVEQLLSDAPETSDVIVVEPKLDKRLSYYKYLKKQTDFEEYTELDVNGLANWLVAKAKQQGGAISSSDARYLVERVGATQQLLANELDKLLLYASQITRKTIDLLTDATPQSTIFQLLEAAFAGNTRHALQLYSEQRALKVEPQNIIAMLTWQLHILALIKFGGGRSPEIIAKEAKLNPYVVKKSQLIARKLDAFKLRTLIIDLAKIDHNSKSVSIDIDEALQHYLIKLSV